MAKGEKQPISHLSTALLQCNAFAFWRKSQPAPPELQDMGRHKGEATQSDFECSGDTASMSKQLPGSQALPQLPPGCVAGQEQPHTPCACAYHEKESQVQKPQ